MGLIASAQLGPCEIVAPLGAGGMGEVYRARDTALGRFVAVKILPETVADDPERLARFEREARALAVLNHPHIAQIHGFEDAVVAGTRVHALDHPGATGPAFSGSGRAAKSTAPGDRGNSPA